MTTTTPGLEGGTRPRRRRPTPLAPRSYRVLQTVHAVLGAAWLGTAVAGVLVLTLVMDEQTVVGASRAVKLIDLLLYIPLDVATLVTGLIFSVKTHWGFLRHGWVAVKYVINLTIFITAGVVLSPAMITLDTLATEHGTAAWAMPEFQAARTLFIAMTSFYCLILATAVVLPLLKPRIPLPYQGRVHRLTVVAVRPETDAAATITLRVPWPLRRRFRYAAGQHVTLHVPVDGVTHPRSYSLASAPGDPGIAITVKRRPGGLVSNHLLDTVAAGSSLAVEEPRGRFGRELDPQRPSTTYLIGAGSGVVPLVPIARTLAAGDPGNVVHLLIGNRSPADVIGADALGQLAATHPGVHLTHVFSRLTDDDQDGRTGRIDRDLLAAYLDEHPAPADAGFYVCGPDAMIDGTIAALEALGIDEDRIHREYFAAAAPPVPQVEVSLTAYLDGEEVRTTSDDRTLVTEALERAGVTPPTTCRVGDCSTCVAQVLEGRAVMRANRALAPGEVADGLVLTCQAVPTTPALVVDYDAAR